MNKKSTLWIFLGIWLVINLVQAYFTGLFNDEAYYYFYSRDLAWGYYDHPPLIAILIRAGYSLFNNELGVRMMIVLLSVGTILVIHKLSEVKTELLFSLFIFSFMIFQVTGFLALPDSVLLFFTALFFLVYKRYSESGSPKDALLLGVMMAGLFYSKYLGILIVFFTLISNYRLLFKRSSWIAVITTTILFLPHLLWQYRHDFPSFYYHLLERSHDEHFRWANIGEFILGQFGQTNPVLFIPAVYLLIIFKPANHFDRALKFTAAGSLLLPFLLMIKGRVEANWTMAGLVPLFIIAYRLFESRPRLKHFLYYTGGFTFIAVILIRILLIYDYLPVKYSRMLRLDYSGWQSFTGEVSKLAGDLPVVFIGTYQGPSHYIFSTGKEAFSFNNALYRGNQFDLEDIEKPLQGRKAMILFNRKDIERDDIKYYNLALADSLLYPTGRYRYYIFDTNYHSYNFIKADILLKDYKVDAGTKLDIPVVLKNPGQSPVIFSESNPDRVYLTYYLLQYGKPLIYKKFEEISRLVLEDEYQTSFRMKVPEKPGVYYLKVSVKCGWFPPGINSRLVKMRVE